MNAIRTVTILSAVLTLVAAPLNAAEIQSPAASSSETHAAAVDPELLSKIRPLYPDIHLERGRHGEAYFHEVRRIASVTADGGNERVVVVVSWGIAHPQFLDRGTGEFLIYADVNDDLPVARKSLFPFGTVRVVAGRWLQFGRQDILLCLASNDALEHFRKQGTGAFAVGLPRGAAERALDVYLKEGLEAFLELAPVRAHREREVGRLPPRISRFDMYPSLVEDSSVPGFKYYNSWEATVLVWLTPHDPSDEAVVLEIGARGLTEGIDLSDVDLLLWETRRDEPADRPGIDAWHQWQERHGESRERRPSDASLCR